METTFFNAMERCRQIARQNYWPHLEPASQVSRRVLLTPQPPEIQPCNSQVKLTVAVYDTQAQKPKAPNTTLAREMVFSHNPNNQHPKLQRERLRGKYKRFART